jgi:hypothetical protein
MYVMHCLSLAFLHYFSPFPTFPVLHNPTAIPKILTTANFLDSSRRKGEEGTYYL